MANAEPSDRHIQHPCGESGPWMWGGVSPVAPNRGMGQLGLDEMFKLAFAASAHEGGKGGCIQLEFRGRRVTVCMGSCFVSNGVSLNAHMRRHPLQLDTPVRWPEAEEELLDVVHEVLVGCWAV